MSEVVTVVELLNAAGRNDYPDEAAAQRLLAQAYGGALLNVPTVQDALWMEQAAAGKGHVVRIDWHLVERAVRELGRAERERYKLGPHPRAVVRLARWLAESRFAPDDIKVMAIILARAAADFDDDHPTSEAEEAARLAAAQKEEVT